MAVIQSPLLGLSVEPNDEQRDLLKELIDLSPVAVFQILNKKLNDRGLCLQIIALPSFQGGEPWQRNTQS